ncbi:MAG: hypothetical protein Kow0059_07870 [Candidatus Sumerlaeia bacterium]
MPFRSFVRTRVVSATLLALFIVPLVAYPTTVKHLTFDQLVLESDLIVRGQCTAKETRWVNGHLETTFDVRVDETLKGQPRSDLLKITVPGGHVDKPISLHQYIPQQPTLYEGEQVVLFLKTTRLKAPADPTGLVARSGTRLLDTPRIYGLWQGKFTILVNPHTGQEFVTRISVEDVGYVPVDDVQRRFHSSLQEDMAAESTVPTIEKVTSKNWERALTSAGAGLDRSKLQRVEQLDVNARQSSGVRTVGMALASQDTPLMQSYAQLKSRVSGIIQKAEAEQQRIKAHQSGSDVLHYLEQDQSNRIQQTRFPPTSQK